MKYTLCLIFLVSCATIGVKPMTNTPSYINPVEGAYEVLKLDSLSLSRKRSVETLTNQKISEIFPQYEVRKVEENFDALWKIIQISLFLDGEHAANLSVSITETPNAQTVSKRIESHFLGITAPINELYIDKNNFSDYTASLNNRNSFVVSAKGNVVVHTNTNINKNIDGIEINKSVLLSLF